MAQVAEAPVLRADTDVDEAALRVGARPGDDVDDPVDGVGSPQRRPRATDHFDTLHVIEQRRIHRASIDEEEELLGETVGEAARRDRSEAGVDVGHVHPRHETQRLSQEETRRQGECARASGQDAVGSCVISQVSGHW